MDRVAKLRPGFFSSFAADIQSGDHLRISTALEHGSKVLARAASREFDFDPEQIGDLNDARRGPHVLDDWRAHVYLSYQLYEQTAVYYYHEQVVYVWMFLNEAIDIKRGQSQLAQEILIDRIATELAI